MTYLRSLNRRHTSSVRSTCVKFTSMPKFYDGFMYKFSESMGDSFLTKMWNADEKLIVQLKRWRFRGTVLHYKSNVGGLLMRHLILIFSAKSIYFAKMHFFTRFLMPKKLY